MPSICWAGRKFPRPQTESLQLARGSIASACAAARTALALNFLQSGNRLGIAVLGHHLVNEEENQQRQYAGQPNPKIVAAMNMKEVEDEEPDCRGQLMCHSRRIKKVLPR